MLNQDIINLYDEYTHRPLPRRVFMDRLVTLTGSVALALSAVSLLESCGATGQLTSAADLDTSYITYAGINGPMQAYVARPRGRQKLSAVVVIHENRGLNAHIEDVTRRAALAGYLALAPNALAPLGGTPANEDDARALFSTLKAEESLENFLRAFAYLDTRPDTNGRYGCVGFCWGGAMANSLAVHLPTLRAAVAFYGRQPAADDVPRIKAAVQLHYAELDERVNAGKDAYEAALSAHGIPYEAYVYAGVNHAFHNDTSAARYHEPSAKLAWGRTLAFFKQHL